MLKRLLTATAVLFVTSFAASNMGHAQTFKAEKFDIKGDGGTDYVAAEAATGRVFVSRGTHMMVVEGATGKVLGDIPNTPGVFGMSPRILPVAPSTTIMWVPRETNTRPVAASTAT